MKGLLIMFRRLYGETDEDQLFYLGKKVKTTVIAFIIGVVCVVVGLIGEMLNSEIAGVMGFAGLIYVIMVYYWGWGFMKAFFGYATFGSIFSGNVVIGVIIFMAYVFLGAFFGIFNAFVGVLRYIYLRVKYKNRAEE